MNKKRRLALAGSRQKAVSYLTKYRLYLIALAAVMVIMLILSFRNAEDQRVYYLTTMDTMIELNFTVPDGSSPEQIRDAVFYEIERLEKLLSRTERASDIYRVNSFAGLEPVKVSRETLFLAALALQYAEISAGAFDPTIGPFIDSWGFLDQEFRLPPEEEIRQLLPLINYRKIIIDHSDATIFLPDKGMVLELGGIAKGYIVDRAAAVLKSLNVKRAFINAGGDITLIGSRPDGQGWKIGVRHPRDDKSIIAALSVSDSAVVTSGDYQRYFEKDGVSYHHIIDPQSGRPAGKLASVTIVASTAAEADALSTAVFVLGPVTGLALIEKIRGVEGVLVTPELEIISSSGLENILELK